MAIDTTNEKFALIAFGRTTDPMMLPVSGGSIGQDDQQQLLWGYPGLLWSEQVLEFILDVNTRIMAYLCDLYSVDMAVGDNTSLVQRNLAGRTGDYNARLLALINDATVV